MQNIETTKTFTHIGHKTHETYTKDKQTNKQTKTLKKTYHTSNFLKIYNIEKHFHFPHMYDIKKFYKGTRT